MTRRRGRYVIDDATVLVMARCIDDVISRRSCHVIDARRHNVMLLLLELRPSCILDFTAVSLYDSLSGADSDEGWGGRCLLTR